MKLATLRPSIRFEKKWPEMLAGILQVAAFILGGMLLARWIWLFFAPSIPALPVKADQAVSNQLTGIIAAHWFMPTSGRIIAPAPAAINFKLMGVYAPSGNNPGFAIFKMADGKQKSVLLKQEIVTGVNLQSINQETVEVGQEGSTQKLGLEKRAKNSTFQLQNAIQFNNK